MVDCTAVCTIARYTILRCTEEPGYIVLVAEIMALYVDISSINLLVACLHFLAFDKALHRLHVYSHFVCWLNETIFEPRLRDRGDGYCFINQHCVDVNAVFPYFLLDCLFFSQIGGVFMSVHG